MTTATVDASNISSTHEKKLSGLQSSSGTINCLYDSADSTGQEVLLNGASVTLKLYPAGNTSGNQLYTVAAIITNVSLENPANMGMVRRNFSFEAASAPVITTVA